MGHHSLLTITRHLKIQCQYEYHVSSVFGRSCEKQEPPNQSCLVCCAADKPASWRKSKEQVCNQACTVRSVSRWRQLEADAATWRMRSRRFRRSIHKHLSGLKLLKASGHTWSASLQLRRSSTGSIAHELNTPSVDSGL